MATIEVQQGRLIGPRVPSIRSTAIRSGATMHYDGIEAILHAAWGTKLRPDCQSRIGDDDYYLPTQEEVALILANSQLDRKQYLEERFDCDDFAYVLKGEMCLHGFATPAYRYALALGMIWGEFTSVAGYHSMNWYVDDQGILRLVEPQNDTEYAADACTGNVGLLLL